MAATQQQKFDFIVRWRESVTRYLENRSAVTAQTERYTAQDLLNEITQEDLDLATGFDPNSGQKTNGIDLVTFQNSINVMTAKTTLDAGEQTVLFTVSN